MEEKSLIAFSVGALYYYHHQKKSIKFTFKIHLIEKKEIGVFGCYVFLDVMFLIFAVLVDYSLPKAFRGTHQYLNYRSCHFHVAFNM